MSMLPQFLSNYAFNPDMVLCYYVHVYTYIYIYIYETAWLWECGCLSWKCFVLFNISFILFSCVIIKLL